MVAMEMTERIERQSAVRVARTWRLPVGWAALVLIAAGTLASAILYARGLDLGAAAFAAAAWLAATLLGLAVWDLVVGLLALTWAPHLSLPDRITFRLPRQVVPVLSPSAFVIGLFIGHKLWH
jgi:hypothetical protein